MHIPLAELLAMYGSTTLVREWAGRMRAAWASHCAEAAEGSGNIGAWLTCDAATRWRATRRWPRRHRRGQPAAPEYLIWLRVQLYKLRMAPRTPAAPMTPPLPWLPRHQPAWEAIYQAVIG